MKVLVNIARFLVGSLFIFSGLVKAIDPKGLSYKMQEFFEVWANDGFMPKLMNWCNNHSLAFSIVMITLEVVLGVALLIGWQKKITTVLLLLLTSFFTFLTAFVLFTVKIKACGCFGDCIPLTPIQTFTKDVVLLILILVLLIGQKYIQPFFSNLINFIIIAASIGLTLFLQTYVQHHLPLKDCLPYKVGNNILELRKMPKDAVPDKYDYSFVYEKGGEKKEFTTAALPDSTWTFVDRKQILVQKGVNNVPLINDFSLTTESGTDTTDAILNQKGEYYLLFIKDISVIPNQYRIEWVNKFYALQQNKIKQNIPSYVVTASTIALLRNKLKGTGSEFSVPIFTCDATAIKTAARSNPTLYLMNGPIVKQKWGSGDLEKLLP